MLAVAEKRNTETVTCRYCGGALSSGGWYGVHRAFHERVCKNASKAERALWLRTRRWRSNSKERAQFLRQRSDEFRAAGLCDSCGADPGTYSRCFDCREKNARQQAKRRERAKGLGLCTSCCKRKARKGWAACRKCQERHLRGSRAAAERARSLGECTKCGEPPTPGLATCFGCRHKAKLYRIAAEEAQERMAA